MATPQTRDISGSKDAVREHDGFSQHSRHVANLPADTLPLGFQAYASTNNRSVALSSQHPANWHQAASIPPPQPGSGPRRGSFPDILPHGHTPPPPINDNVLNLRGGMSDMHRGAISGPDDAQTDSDPEFRLSTPSSRLSRPPCSDGLSESVDASTIFVDSRTDTPGPVGNEQIAATKGGGSRRNKQYVLPDGSVVSGKGLGRGRPGIKRGPRKSQTGETSSSMIASNGTDVSFHDAAAPSRKRKSTESETSNLRLSTVDSAMSGSEESSEEYNPTAHTRFGRHTQKPTTLVDAVAATASPSGKLSRNNSTFKATSNSPASHKTHPKIKRRVYRGREQFALCEHCLRGYGPPGNVIVFCDACNKCWHQRCHEPQISKQTVSDSKAEWFCAECDRILHGKRKEKKSEGKPAIQPIVVANPIAQQAPTYAGPLVGGRFLKPEQKLAYLKTLSKEDMVSRLLHASDLAPDLPLFQTLMLPPAPVVMPQPQFTSTYVTPVSKVPSFAGKETGEDDEVDEGYDGYFDEHAALYPKPGQGLQLPPESDDLHMLLEGKDSKTFSHWVGR